MSHNFLEFYEDGIFVERSSSFGTRIREGKYEKRQDTILIYYNNNNATSKVWKGTIRKDAILFQNSNSRALEYQHVQNRETKPIDWDD